MKKSKESCEPKSELAGFFVFIMLIIVGVAVGYFLYMLTASHSGIAKVISMIMLPLSVVTGVFIWQIILIVYSGCKIGSSFVKGFKKAGLKNALSQKVGGFPQVLPFTLVFVFVSGAVSFIIGIIVAFIPDVHGFFRIVCLYAITGLVYGFFQRKLVRSGYFMVLESDYGSYVKDKDTDL